MPTQPALQQRQHRDSHLTDEDITTAQNDDLYHPVHTPYSPLGETGPSAGDIYVVGLDKPAVSWIEMRNPVPASQSADEETIHLSLLPGVNEASEVQTSMRDPQMGKTTTPADNNPRVECKSRQGISKKRSNPAALGIIMLTTYSTVLSGIWLIVSIVQPRFSWISSGGSLSPETASVLTTLIAKTIEMSFVAVFLALTGQALSRRAVSYRSQGITISEITMRNWLTQPGLIFTDIDILRHGVSTPLGIFILLATVASTFYITASDALVRPTLVYGPWESMTLKGFARAGYADLEYIKATCETFQTGIDPKEAGGSCNFLEYSAWTTLISFSDAWMSFVNKNPSGTVDLRSRPSWSTSFNNMTLRGSWVDTEYGNVTANYASYGRIINNVTMAIPHPGVHSAATHPDNRILQPKDLDGVGEYTLRASVVSPTINVLCVNMSPDEIRPIVYVLWPDALVVNKSAPFLTTTKGWEKTIPPYPDFRNRTAVDDIFQWGPQYNRRHPIFQLLPSVFNTVTYTVPGHNYSSPEVPLSDAVYVMAKPNGTTDYTVCQLRSWASTGCFTKMLISGKNGADMEPSCDKTTDSGDSDNYNKRHPGAFSAPSPSWRSVADVWMLTLGLQAANADSAGARALSLAALVTPQLTPTLPSIAELLAVIGGVPLLKSSLGSTVHARFDHEPELNTSKPGFAEDFHVSVRQQQYTSAYNKDDKWKGIFYVVLALVFLLNCFCLQYFIRKSGFLTDFTEPANIFTLAVNSPPSAQLFGACGGGPRGRDLAVPFRVAYDEGHFFFQEASSVPWRGRYKGTVASGASRKPLLDDPAQTETGYWMLSSRKNWL